MARQSGKHLIANYLVIRCKASDSAVKLGAFGDITIAGKSVMLFFVGNPPKIKGLDAFELALVAAVPETVRTNIKDLLNQNVPPEKLLDTVSRTFRGTIFASERKTKNMGSLTAATTVEQLMSQITRAIIRLAISENVAPKAPKKKGGKQRATTSARTRAISTLPRRIPRQFELMPTPLHF